MLSAAPKRQSAFRTSLSSNYNGRSSAEQPSYPKRDECTGVGLCFYGVAEPSIYGHRGVARSVCHLPV